MTVRPCCLGVVFVGSATILVKEIRTIRLAGAVIMRGRALTASERIYRKLLDAATERRIRES